jgi:hypothetical protein
VIDRDVGPVLSMRSVRRCICIIWDTLT